MFCWQFMNVKAANFKLSHFNLQYFSVERAGFYFYLLNFGCSVVYSFKLITLTIRDLLE